MSDHQHYQAIKDRSHEYSDNTKMLVGFIFFGFICGLLGVIFYPKIYCKMGKIYLPILQMFCVIVGTMVGGLLVLIGCKLVGGFLLNVKDKIGGKLS